jgi:hypothetical protein
MIQKWMRRPPSVPRAITRVSPMTIRQLFRSEKDLRAAKFWLPLATAAILPVPRDHQIEMDPPTISSRFALRKVRPA